MRPRLVTIPISHYGERARWALDHAAVDYDERHHVQLFSWVAAYGTGGQKTLPVLVTSDGTLTDSADIVRWASERATTPLFPRDPHARSAVEELAADLAAGFGIATRKVVYEWAARATDTLVAYNIGRAPAVEAAAMQVGVGVAMTFLQRYLDVNAATVRAAVDEIDRRFDWVADRLGDGRRHLDGDTFDAADLTFASLAAPCVLPDRYGATLPRPDELPDDARARVLRWRAHPAGAFALRLYDERPVPRGHYARPLRVPPRDARHPR